MYKCILHIIGIGRRLTDTCTSVHYTCTCFLSKSTIIHVHAFACVILYTYDNVLLEVNTSCTLHVYSNVGVPHVCVLMLHSCLLYIYFRPQESLIQSWLLDSFVTLE